MKELTAVFMDVLGRKTGQEERATAIVRESMRAEFGAHTKDILASGTCFFSDEGYALRQELYALERRIDKFSNAAEAGELSVRLKEMFIRAEELHRETQKEIRKPGHIRAPKLHFFYGEEQEAALEILEDYIHTEMFRILVMGGGELFQTLAPLKGYAHNLEERMHYLTDVIYPVTDTETFRKVSSSRYWAAVHQEEMRQGPMGRLPGMLMTDPVKTDHRFIPGEHRLLPWRNGVVLQGIGYLTNVTPKNIEEAQAKGRLQTSVSSVLLRPYTSYVSDPDSVLAHVFEGRLYVISPAQYFAAASFAEANAALSSRSRLGQCLFCGRDADAGTLCSSCSRRIRIV